MVSSLVSGVDQRDSSIYPNNMATNQRIASVGDGSVAFDRLYVVDTNWAEAVCSDTNMAPLVTVFLGFFSLDTTRPGFFVPTYPRIYQQNMNRQTISMYFIFH